MCLIFFSFFTCASRAKCVLFTVSLTRWISLNDKRDVYPVSPHSCIKIDEFQRHVKYTTRDLRRECIFERFTSPY